MGVIHSHDKGTGP